MQNFIKGYSINSAEIESNYILTFDPGLASTLGTIGFEVYLIKHDENSLPHYRIIEPRGIKIEEEINNYYLGYIVINSHILAKNIEVLSNITDTSEPICFDVDVNYYQDEEDEYIAAV